MVRKHVDPRENNLAAQPLGKGLHDLGGRLGRRVVNNFASHVCAFPWSNFEWSEFMQGGRAAGPGLSDLCGNPAWGVACPICVATRLWGPACPICAATRLGALPVRCGVVAPALPFSVRL